VPAEHCKGAGDFFVNAVFPFTLLDKDSKKKLKDRLNNIASVCMYSNGEAKLCEEEEQPKNGGEGEDELLASIRERGRGSVRRGSGAAETKTGPRRCCHFYEMGTKIKPGPAEIRFKIKLAFEDDDVGDDDDDDLIKVSVEFSLKFKAEATGIQKNWLCPGVCQQDTTTANVDLVIDGWFKPSLRVPGLGFDANVQIDLKELRIGLGEFVNTCDFKSSSV
jgi:hypothetical protein